MNLAFSQIAMTSPAAPRIVNPNLQFDEALGTQIKNLPGPGFFGFHADDFRLHIL